MKAILRPTDSLLDTIIREKIEKSLLKDNKVQNEAHAKFGKQVVTGGRNCAPGVIPDQTDNSQERTDSASVEGLNYWWFWW